MLVCICYLTLFLAIIVICSNVVVFLGSSSSSSSLCICLTLIYHTFHLNFIHLHATLMVCFTANLLLRTTVYEIANSSSVQQTTVQCL